MKFYSYRKKMKFILAPLACLFASSTFALNGTEAQIEAKDILQLEEFEKKHPKANPMLSSFKSIM